MATETGRIPGGTGLGSPEGAASSAAALPGAIPCAFRPRSPAKRAALRLLYYADVPIAAIAAEIGGTPQGVRGTIRKMRDRGQLAPRPNPSIKTRFGA